VSPGVVKPNSSQKPSQQTNKEEDKKKVFKPPEAFEGLQEFCDQEKAGEPNEIKYKKLMETLSRAQSKNRVLSELNDEVFFKFDQLILTLDPTTSKVRLKLLLQIDDLGIAIQRFIDQAKFSANYIDYAIWWIRGRRSYIQDEDIHKEMEPIIDTLRAAQYYVDKFSESFKKEFDVISFCVSKVSKKNVDNVIKTTKESLERLKLLVHISRVSDRVDTVISKMTELLAGKKSLIPKPSSKPLIDFLETFKKLKIGKRSHRKDRKESQKNKI